MSPVRLSLALATVVALTGCVAESGPYQTSAYEYGYGRPGYDHEYFAGPTTAIEGGWGWGHRRREWDRDQDRDWGRR